MKAQTIYQVVEDAVERKRGNVLYGHTKAVTYYLDAFVSQEDAECFVEARMKRFPQSDFYITPIRLFSKDNE